MSASTRELEVRVSSRDCKKDSAVSVVVVEAADLGQSRALAVEADEIL